MDCRIKCGNDETSSLRGATPTKQSSLCCRAGLLRFARNDATNALRLRIKRAARLFRKNARRETS